MWLTPCRSRTSSVRSAVSWVTRPRAAAPKMVRVLTCPARRWRSSMIPTLTFGRTGHVSTRTIFGAAALGRVTQDTADRTLDVLLRHGVNHIDTAASYGDAELRIGPWMAEYRDRFFLATKIGERRYGPARNQIRRSLERLRVDHVDLIQLHHLIDPA